MTTKRQLCEDAFAELALAGHAFDLAPEDMQTALRRLDMMLARWDGEGITLGYALPDPLFGSELDDESGVPDAAVETVVANLAVRLAAHYGRQVAPQTALTAKQGYDELVGKAVRPRPQQMPADLPRGAGNRHTNPWNPFFPPPDTGPLQTGEGGDLDIL